MNFTEREQKKFREASKGKKGGFLSNTFKLWVVSFIFLLIGVHLYAITIYPEKEIISQEILLGIALALIGYLWIQELRDRHSLQLMNKALMDANEQLERAEIDTIATLILTEEAKDPYVRGHSKRVAACALAIAKEMGFSEDRLKIMERSGILHDLGKLSIMDNILNKAGKLNDEEWTLMKKHPRTAVEILEPLKFLSIEKEIICHHHERYDGAGYPDGLKGEAVPLESRILAVADTFDAMNSRRAYREPLSREKILDELKSVSGKQLDSFVVNIFLKLLDKKPDLWDKD